MKVRNLTSTRGNKVPNQFVIESDNTTTFQSYDSTIAEVGSDTIKIYPNYNYSVTTNKYRNLFFTEIGFYEIASLAELRTAIKNGFCLINGRQYKVETV